MRVCWSVLAVPVGQASLSAISRRAASHTQNRGAQHLHAVGTLVREQVGTVRVRSAEDLDHSGNSRFGAGTHVQWLAGQPHRLDANHRYNSRVHAAKSAAALTG